MGEIPVFSVLQTMDSAIRRTKTIITNSKKFTLAKIHYLLRTHILRENSISSIDLHTQVILYLRARTRRTSVTSTKPT